MSKWEDTKESMYKRAEERRSFREKILKYIDADELPNMSYDEVEKIIEEKENRKEHIREFAHTLMAMLFILLILLALMAF
jgi:beta-N-acetylglucosaminidase